MARNPRTSTCVCTALLNVDVGATVPLQAAVTGIADGVTELTVMLPNAGVFTDVPVIDAAVPALAASARNGAPQPLDLATAGTSATGVLTAHSDRLDAPVSTTRTRDQVDINLAADVLFRVDSADLTPAAATSITAAVTDLRKAGPGPLTVTGHTDDDGSVEHNRSLSERRAATVAAALERTLPAAQWPRTVLGKGETAPVARNTSAAGRQLNRRVTISYRTRAATTEPAAATSAAPTIPETKGVRGKAPEGVHVSLDGYRSAVGAGHGTLQIVAQSATRRGDYLLVVLLARNGGGDEATLWDYFGGGVFEARHVPDSYIPFGITATYPLDYETERYIHPCLCDKDLADKLPPGSERLLPLWYPAPLAGTGTTTVDLPDRFRITDVPIT
ncbi:OmpA family protein [Micromonosporaceae bacterium Da 78-11]